VEAAHGASKKRDCYLQAQYRRLVTRRGKKKALVAVGHSIIVIVYYILLNGEPYRDLGPDHFDERRQECIRRHHVRQLQRLGYAVTLEPLAPAA
jgi:transposase